MTSTRLETIPVSRPQIGLQERAAVERVLLSGALAQGAEVAAFEAEFAAELAPGTTCVAVSSGTTALHLGLLAAGIGPGDEVVVPSFTFAATANAVVLAGATPVFADIEPGSFCLDPHAVRQVITERTRALLPVHLFGHPADVTALTAIADEHGLLLFEDTAQAHGARWHGRPVGTFGAWGAYSLYPTKNMTSGEGGMLSCAPTAGVVRALHLLRNQGMLARYANEVVGFNARMSEMHAALGRVQLSRLAGFTERRRANARFFDDHLTGVVTPPVTSGAQPVHHQYTVRVPEGRDGVAAALLAEHGVGTGVYYPTPVHRLPSFHNTAELPETERAAAEVLSLPVHPGLDDADRERIVTGVNAVLAAGA